MSSCDLQLVFDRADRTYRFGEDVSGTVLLDAHTELECRNVVLTYQWRTHGRGNTASGKEESLLLSDQRHFREGTHEEYRFTLTVPPGPMTYHGHSLNVGWYVKARADIPWGIDAKDEQEFILLAGDTTKKVVLGDELASEENLASLPESVTWIARARDLRKDPFFRISIIIAFVTAVAASIFVDYWSDFWSFFTFPVTLFAVFFGIKILRDRMVRQKLGDVDVHVEPSSVHPGDHVSCRVQSQSKGNAFLEKVTATLYAEERVVSGSSGSKGSARVYTHTVYEHPFVQSFHEQLVEGRRIDVECSFVIPPEAPSTFTAKDNALSWFVTVQIGIKNWPDWVQSFPITVFPK
ncbi:MAG: hypothetical protein HY731_00530 [Candidatus Tectomicrobia bacterium]|nr:hypothetical protein [Candidatus Tectomicrobia bacterium]